MGHNAMTRHNVLRRISLFLGLCAATGFITAATAQTYPSKPITMIVPFAAGGPLDFVARSLSERLTAGLGQPIVIDNRVGAGGNIGTAAAAQAAPDGYTLLFVLSGTLVANPAVFDKLPFNAEKSFEPISLVTSNSQMLVVHQSLPVNSVAEFVAYAKKQPLTYAHAGPGSGGHLAMGYFGLLAGFSGTGVPYRGNAPLMIDLSGGQVGWFHRHGGGIAAPEVRKAQRSRDRRRPAFAAGSQCSNDRRGWLSADEAQHVFRTPGTCGNPQTHPRRS
jgi:tripartite-type tricarboxylate transporter receptor subunit TctC